MYALARALVVIMCAGQLLWPKIYANTITLLTRRIQQAFMRILLLYLRGVSNKHLCEYYYFTYEEYPTNIYANTIILLTRSIQQTFMRILLLYLRGVSNKHLCEYYYFTYEEYPTSIYANTITLLTRSIQLQQQHDSQIFGNFFRYIFLTHN